MDPVSQIKLTPLNFYCDLMNVDSFLEEFVGVQSIIQNGIEQLATDHRALDDTSFRGKRFFTYENFPVGIEVIQ